MTIQFDHILNSLGLLIFICWTLFSAPRAGQEYVSNYPHYTKKHLRIEGVFCWLALVVVHNGQSFTQPKLAPVLGI